LCVDHAKGILLKLKMRNPPAPSQIPRVHKSKNRFSCFAERRKYAWQSTLYRQAQIMAGFGVAIDRQTLSRWMKSAALIAKALYDLQLKTMHGFGRLFCDETPMKVLDRGGGGDRGFASFGHMPRMIAPGRGLRRKRSPMSSPAVAARRRFGGNWLTSRAFCMLTATPPIPR
jgi:hypothetical protein